MRKIDLTGHIYGRLTVIKEVEPYISPKGRKRLKWLCKCECGVKKEIEGNSLRRSNTTSCGCLKKENHGGLKHGDYGSKEYTAWNNMTQRCYNPNDIGYANYGGRGITVCQQWKDSYEAFLKDVGHAPTPTNLI